MVVIDLSSICACLVSVKVQRKFRNFLGTAELCKDPILQNYADLLNEYLLAR